MGNLRYTEQFKLEAIRQVTEWGFKTKEVSQRLGISSKSLYLWVKKSKQGNTQTNCDKHEIVRLKNELKRVQEEREILKKTAAYLAKASG